MTLKQINKIVKFCLKKLRLPPIKVLMVEESLWVGTFRYDGAGVKEIEIDGEKIRHTDKEWAYESIWKYINYKPRYKWEYGFYVIAHEVGHYLQYARYGRWLYRYIGEVEQYFKSYKKFSLKKYHSFKIEKNANKTALILLKMAKKEGFKLDK